MTRTKGRTAILVHSGRTWFLGCFLCKCNFRCSCHKCEWMRPRCYIRTLKRSPAEKWKMNSEEKWTVSRDLYDLMWSRLGYRPLTRESEPALLPEIYRGGTKAGPDRVAETEPNVAPIGHRFFHCHVYVYMLRINNNYSPKWRWIAVDINRAAPAR